MGWSTSGAAVVSVVYHLSSRRLHTKLISRSAINSSSEEGRNHLQEEKHKEDTED